MKKIEQAIPKSLINGLILSTTQGLNNGDHFYDQLHYINRRFVENNFDFLSSIVVSAIEGKHPGLTTNDLAYVNDFVAPVNLHDAQIHTRHKTNKYEWHVDGIDRSIGPCYNLWIPLYRMSALDSLDDRSLFDVIERDKVPGLYQENSDPVSYQLFEKLSENKNEIALIQQFIGATKEEMENSLLYQCKSGKMKLFPKTELHPTSVIKPQLGDAYVFSSSQFHSSGPSDFERIGISIKFIVKNPKQGFRKVMNENRAQAIPLTSWLSLFIGCYDQYNDFTSYRNYIDFCIQAEKTKITQNQSKINSVKSVLEQIYQEI